MINGSEAVERMLEALSLRMKRRRFRTNVLGVTEGKNDVVRCFISKDGQMVEWYNDNPSILGIEGNGIPRGSWTVFKDSDNATFSLFTEKMKHFRFEHNRLRLHQNPFYGCMSPEEVLIRCDLLDGVL